ncbi:hypothetical protein FZC71_13565 [Bacillus subtilis]|nr:hypothetical protein FZC71_13565 [Bacillus subtilis]
MLMVTATFIPLFLPTPPSKKTKRPPSLFFIEMRAFGGPISCPIVFLFEYHVNSNYSDMSTLF